jgi:2-keto-3-deoxy-6-phosphogluconate aldolase
MQRIIIDPESTSLAERFALIKAANRRRGRFPEGCVTVVESEAAARAGRDDARKLHPAVVYGPSSSSEGQRLYYLVRWL